MIYLDSHYQKHVVFIFNKSGESTFYNKKSRYTERQKYSCLFFPCAYDEMVYDDFDSSFKIRITLF